MKSAVFLVGILLVGCTSYKNQPVAEFQKLRWPSFDSLAIQNEQLLASALTQKFYRANHYTRVWIDSGGLTQSADSMIHFIGSAKLHGLNSEDYHFGELIQLVQSPQENAVRIELYLTDGFFAIHHHLKNGRLQRRSFNLVNLDVAYDTSALSSLKKGLASNGIRIQLISQEPVHSQYHDLKATLEQILSSGKKDEVTLKRIDQLIVNMERWRWQKKPVPERYIGVNVPSFQLKVVEGDSVVLESRVIIGRPETQTPELESVIRSFIIYPYWHVPRSILKEILPGIQKDTSYLKKHNYQVLDQNGKLMDATKLDWSAFDHKTFPYVLRQREGSENTMGVIKFVFNNNYNVYLHDTNARGLFRQQNRALSHGCVRVQKAVELARYLAKDDDTYVGPEDLDQYLIVQHKMTVDVVKPIPVLLQYFTAVREKDGVVFYDDIYGKDREILNALYHYSMHTEGPAFPPFL